MRRAFALVATAGLVALTLSACSSNPDAACIVHSGKASSLVTVKGAIGDEPKVDFPTPLKTQKTERSTIIEGKGQPLVAGQAVRLSLSLYNGTTGDLVTQAGYGDAGSLLALNDNTFKGLAQGLQCVPVGSRVALTVPPKDGFGEQGNPQLGVEASDSLVFVVDVKEGFLTRANGAPQPSQPGFPHVVLAPDGRPGITVPKTKAPSKPETALLKSGDGAKVKRGASVVVQYTAVSWDDPSVLKSTWQDGQPALIRAEAASKVEQNASVPGVLKGLADAMVGQRVGSQLLVVLPPASAKQKSGESPENVALDYPNEALVYVIDILGIG